MAEDEPNLSASMQKLKIMPRPRPARISRDDDLQTNPFGRRHKSKSQSNLALFGPSCACKRNRQTIKSTTQFKRPTNKLKLIRDPIIVFVDNCTHIPPNNNNNNNNNVNKINCKQVSADTKLFGGSTSSSQQDFKSIVAGCELLSLTTSNKCDSDLTERQPNFTTKNFRELRSSARRNCEQSVASSSCSQQAMTRLCLNPPCDVTIDELASYFETFVHIPKKMSSMAEMMYI